MKTEKRKNYIICVMFCGFLALFFFMYLFWPKAEFSEKEKRYLQDMPPLSWSTVISGEFGTKAEKAAADHMPWRDFFLWLNAEFDRPMNLQSTKDLYVGVDGRLFERPYRYDQAAIARNMKAINGFANKLEREVNLMLVPSAGYLLSEDIAGLSEPYIDDRLIDEAYTLAGASTKPVRLLECFQSLTDPASLYYRGDHHWTSLGAYTACDYFLSTLGRDLPGKERYTVRKVDGFYGTTYSRACFWNIAPESLELWDSGDQYTVQFSDKEGKFDSVFFPERLNEMDKYPVWLDGNHPLVIINNQSEEAEGELLIVRDSFGSCFAPFAAEEYETVVLVDLRYYKLPVSQLFEQWDFDDVLIMYYIGNFMNDTNLIWLS